MKPDYKIMRTYIIEMYAAGIIWNLLEVSDCDSKFNFLYYPTKLMTYLINMI